MSRVAHRRPASPSSWRSAARRPSMETATMCVACKHAHGVSFPAEAHHLAPTCWPHAAMRMFGGSVTLPLEKRATDARCDAWLIVCPLCCERSTCSSTSTPPTATATSAPSRELLSFSPSCHAVNTYARHDSLSPSGRAALVACHLETEIPDCAHACCSRRWAQWPLVPETSFLQVNGYTGYAGCARPSCV